MPETPCRPPRRERDALGRPLPPGVKGVEPVPEDALPPLDAIALASELIETGRPFAAHEVMEAVWKSCPDAERPLWQGLAQLCVGLTHEARGFPDRAVRLLERGASRLDGYDGPSYGLDLPRLVADARERARRLTA